MNSLQIFLPQNFNVSDFFMFEVSKYKAKIEEKESRFTAAQYNTVVLF